MFNFLCLALDQFLTNVKADNQKYIYTLIISNQRLNIE